MFPYATSILLGFWVVSFVYTWSLMRAGDTLRPTTFSDTLITAVTSALLAGCALYLYNDNRQSTGLLGMICFVAIAVFLTARAAYAITRIGHSNKPLTKKGIKLNLTVYALNIVAALYLAFG